MPASEPSAVLHQARPLRQRVPLSLPSSFSSHVATIPRPTEAIESKYWHSFITSFIVSLQFGLHVFLFPVGASSSPPSQHVEFIKTGLSTSCMQPSRLQWGKMYPPTPWRPMWDKQESSRPSSSSPVGMASLHIPDISSGEGSRVQLSGPRGQIGRAYFPHNGQKLKTLSQSAFGFFDLNT